MNDEIQKIVEVKYKHKKRVKIVKYFFISVLVVIIIFILPIIGFFEKHYNKWKRYNIFKTK